MDERWELFVDGHACTCELRDGVVYVTVTGRGQSRTKRCAIGGADAGDVGLRLCFEIIAELKGSRPEPITLSPECLRIQTARYEILGEMSKLDEKRDHYTVWPKSVLKRFLELSAERDMLREEWIRLRCGSQL